MLAETLGSVAAQHCVDMSRYYCVGLEINANHIRSARGGRVTGTARPIHIGERSQVWDIRIEDDQERLICISRLTVSVLEGSAQALAAGRAHETPALAWPLAAGRRTAGWDADYKGPLTLPEKSGPVVIRRRQAEPGSETAEETTRAATAPATPTPEVPAPASSPGPGRLRRPLRRKGAAGG